MGKFGWSYPPGCSGPPDEPAVADLMPLLREYGRVDRDGQVLLMGKDADLDYGGQIVIRQAWVLADDGVCLAEVYCYANICEPVGEDGESEKSLEARRELAGDIVTTWNEYPGEWTGSDYWTFWLSPNDGAGRRSIDPIGIETGYFVECPMVDAPDEADDEANAEAIYKAIMADPGIVAFRENMTELAKAIDAITPEEVGNDN